MERFYGELAAYWPLISPVAEYEEEAGAYVRLIKRAQPKAKTVLELGAGGGNNAFFMKRRFELVLSDLSDAMLEQSRRINPTCEHVVGDMRVLRVGRRFDAVFVHDAVDYMTSEGDLARVFATAFAHLDAGGVLVVTPDATREGFVPSTDCGGSDGDDGRSVRYLEWSYDPDPRG